MKIRNDLAALEKLLYSAATPERERADLSMRVSVARARYARAIRVPLWSATAALEECNADD